MPQPLILLTNDDGVDSPGLHAAAGALFPLGDVVVAAPIRQQSGMGQSLPKESSGKIYERTLVINGEDIRAFGIEGSPAQTVAHGILELVSRKPDLVVSGINFGENLSVGVTVSGTVGAALHGAHWQIPSIAVSLEAPVELMYHYDDTIDFSAAAHFTRHFAMRLLSKDMPVDADLLKIDVPATATTETVWRLTRLDRNPRYISLAAKREQLSDTGPLGFTHSQFGRSADDTDVAAIEDQVVTVTPLSIDLTSRADFSEIEKLLRD